MTAMHFDLENIYHVYNRGNNRIPIFFNDGNYKFLLEKVRREWLPLCEIFCYCLMPNHFHFMLEPKHEGCETITQNGNPTNLQKLSKKIGKTLSSYTQAINLQNHTTGNLFQKKTKAKCLTEHLSQEDPYKTNDYLLNCFLYIHNNPLKAHLVESLTEWPYSSWPDYYQNRSGDLCNLQKGRNIIGLTELDFQASRSKEPDEKIIERLF